MVLFNYSTRELTAKVVYYGPGLCGKTSNLQYVHENLPNEVRGKMLSLATKTDRTLFFDFLPIDLGEIRGMKTRVQLYTVPGQVFYNETRKLVLKGADGIVFVADSQDTMLGANVESFRNLEENLKAHAIKLAEIPHIIQFNKRDLPKLSSIEDLNGALNKYNAPFYESVATTGIGVQDTLKAIVKLVLLQLTRKYDPKAMPAEHQRSFASVPAAAAGTSAFTTARSVSAVAAGTTSDALRLAPAAHADSAGFVAAVVTSEGKSGGTARGRRAKSTAATPPPIVRAGEDLPSFGDDEIDGLVGEVAGFDAPQAPAWDSPPTPASLPPGGSPKARREDEGVWLGADDEPSVFPAAQIGSADALGDLFAEDVPQAPEPAARSHEEAPAWSAAPEPSGPSFEIDRGFDPEWMPEQEAVETKAVENGDAAPQQFAPPPEPERPQLGVTAGPGEGLVLTEVVGDDELFNDPSLEVAHLAGGEAREIVVPVMIGEGASAKRYKLSIRLRLDDVD